MSLYSPAELIVVINRDDIKKNALNLFTELFFTRKVTLGSRDIALDIIDAPDIPIAAFCSPMVGSRVSRDEGYETKVIRPGYLKPKASIDPEKIAVRPANTDPRYNNPEYSRKIKIVQMLEQQRTAIKARIEWLAVNAITTGRNIIEGDGIERYEIDWGLGPSNRITQFGPSAWSGKDRNTFDPNDDIERYAEQSEGTINIVIMGSKVWKLYRQFKAIKDALDSRRGSNSQLETSLKDLGEAASFKGYMGDVAIVVYNGRYTNEDGSEVYFMDQDLMVMGNTGIKGVVAYAAIMDPELVRDGVREAEMAPKNYIVPGDPAIEYVQTHSAPQPIPARINRFVTITIA